MSDFIIDEVNGSIKAIRRLSVPKPKVSAVQEQEPVKNLLVLGRKTNTPVPSSNIEASASVPPVQSCAWTVKSVSKPVDFNQLMDQQVIDEVKRKEDDVKQLEDKLQHECKIVKESKSVNLKEFADLASVILAKHPKGCSWHWSSKGCYSKPGNEGVMSIGDTVLCCSAGYHANNPKKTQQKGVCICKSVECDEPYHIHRFAICKYYAQGKCTRSDCLFYHPKKVDTEITNVAPSNTESSRPPKKESSLDFYLRNCPLLGPILDNISVKCGKKITTITNCQYKECRMISDPEHCKVFLHGPSVLGDIPCPLGAFPHGCCAFKCKCKAPLRKDTNAFGAPRAFPPRAPHPRAQ
jgi:hypothetical protein